MKHWKNIIIVIIAGLYFPLMFSFIAVDKSKTVCGEISPAICDSVENKFITQEDIRDIVLGKFTGILGRRMSEVDCNEVEEFFTKHPAVENCEVYFTYGGALHIDVTQREPLVRVFDGNDSYYLDVEGRKMPLFKNHSAHALVAAGFIKRLPSINDLVLISKNINNDAFWKAQIEQVYVDEHGELILVPRVGDHLIEFGSIEDMDKKFRNLKALYKKGWDTREWNLYKKVNLKYKGQIVCSKG